MIPKTPAPSATTPSVATVPTPTPTPTTNDLTGPVGTIYTDTTTNNSGATVKYMVKLTHFHQHAAPDNSFDGAPAGKHLAAAEFLITGLKGHESDDANSDATAQGNNSQTYQASFDGLAAGTNFNSGQFSVSPAQIQIGWVSFEVPDGVKIASVEWDGSGGFGSNPPATWTVRP
jgi:hypothetical protein